MSPLKEIPFENPDIDYIITLKNFVQPVLFPFKTTWKDQRILYVGDKSSGAQLLEKQFPEADVKEGNIDDVVSPGFRQEGERFDYIAAAGIKSAAGDIGTLLNRLVSLLKPGGIIAAGVYSYAGYYGLEMLSTVIKRFSADMKNISAGKNISHLKRITAAVLEQLPGHHPVFHRKGFMERLARGDTQTLKELVNISADRIFTVSQLLKCLDEGDGRFIGWVMPSFYDPAQYIENKDLVETLKALKKPHNWAAAELINASPPEHYFFLGRKDYQPVTIGWDSDDLYLWRPVRLPLYQWENLEETSSDTIMPNPVKECIGIGTVKLQPWEAQLCRAADGTINVDRLSVPVKKSSLEIQAFLKRAVNNRLLALLPPS